GALAAEYPLRTQRNRTSAIWPLAVEGPSEIVTDAPSWFPCACSSIERPAEVSEKIRYPTLRAPRSSDPVEAMTVLPTDRVVFVWHGVLARHSARTPPTPPEDTKSVRPRICRVGDWLAVRAGADPLVENGTSVMYRPKLSLETSWPVMWTRRRWPLAWASSERPAPVSVKKMIPPPWAGICSEPVLA